MEEARHSGPRVTRHPLRPPVRMTPAGAVVVIRTCVMHLETWKSTDEHVTLYPNGLASRAQACDASVTTRRTARSGAFHALSDPRPGLFSSARKEWAELFLLTPLLRSTL